MLVAGADGNRTHRGRDTPPIGFEDRARHQTTNYSLNKHSENRINKYHFILLVVNQYENLLMQGQLKRAADSAALDRYIVKGR